MPGVSSRRDNLGVKVLLKMSQGCITEFGFWAVAKAEPVRKYCCCLCGAFCIFQWKRGHSALPKAVFCSRTPSVVVQNIYFKRKPFSVEILSAQQLFFLHFTKKMHSLKLFFKKFLLESLLSCPFVSNVLILSFDVIQVQKWMWISRKFWADTE